MHQGKANVKRLGHHKVSEFRVLGALNKPAFKFFGWSSDGRRISYTFQLPYQTHAKHCRHSNEKYKEWGHGMAFPLESKPSSAIYFLSSPGKALSKSQNHCLINGGIYTYLSGLQELSELINVMCLAHSYNSASGSYY